MLLHPNQLQQDLPKKLHGRPQVKVMNNLSMPLPESESEAEEDMNTT